MNQLINWWLNYNDLSEEEFSFLSQVRPSTIIKSKKYNNKVRQILNLMPNCNIQNQYYFKVSESATNFINYLFDTYVDNETLVISSNMEHENTQKRLNKCQNVYYIDYYNEVKYLKFKNILNEIKKYKKVFVYIIGTQISSGEITPQLFFENLKICLDDNGLKYKMVIDDVHGMYIVPRNYDIFDYVIGTAHALVRNFDMGIMLCKTNDDIGYEAYNWICQYYDAIQIILSRYHKLSWFKTVMIEYFQKELTNDRYSIVENTVPNIFSIKVKNANFTKAMAERLEPYEIRLENCGNNKDTFIRFRGQQFIQFPKYLEYGLKILKDIMTIEDELKKC